MTKETKSLLKLLETDCGKPGHVLLVPAAMRDVQPNEERMKVSEIATSKGVEIHVSDLTGQAMILEEEYYKRWRDISQ